MTKQTAYRILLIDDHPAVRQGLRILLETQNHRVVAEASSYDETLDCLNEADVDIALLDLTLQDRSGLELIPKLEDDGIAVLVYTMHEDFNTIDRVFKSGALGYVSKREEPVVLLEAIETIGDNKRFLSPLAIETIQEKGTKEPRLESSLSDREREIFNLMGKGTGNLEIANSLNISPRTVETYFTRITQKLKCKNRRELRKYAISMVLDQA